jgi:hypothetical protein
MYEKIILLKSKIRKYLFLVPIDMDVRMKAIALSALFLIVTRFLSSFISIIYFFVYRIFLILLKNLDVISDSQIEYIQLSKLRDNRFHFSHY